MKNSSAAREFKTYLRGLTARMTDDGYSDMEIRKAILTACIENERRKCQEAVAPYAKALNQIRICEGPAPIDVGGGIMMKYVGPLPVWTKRGCKWPEERKNGMG